MLRIWERRCVVPFSRLSGYSTSAPMKLPASDAIIPPDKLRDYLLSPTHPDGRAKAEYLGRLGYSQDTFRNWRRISACKSCVGTLSRCGQPPTGRNMRSSDR